MFDEEQLSESQAVLMELVDTGDSLLNRTSFSSAHNGLARWIRTVGRALNSMPGGDVLADEWLALPTPDHAAMSDNGRAEDWAPLQEAVHARLNWLMGTVRVLANPIEPAAPEDDLADEVAGDASESIVDFDDLIEEDDELPVQPPLEPSRRAQPAAAAAIPARVGAPASAGALAPSGQAVMLIHGRDLHARDAVVDFLRSLGLEPLAWSDAIRATGRMVPNADEALDCALSLAQAIVIIMTGEDEARLSEMFINDSDPPHESQLTAQARPEVLFAAGLAFGRAPLRTILVEIGTLRPFSTTCGCPVIHLDDSSQRRYEFFKRLEAAGCQIVLKDKSWHTAGTFDAAA